MGILLKMFRKLKMIKVIKSKTKPKIMRKNQVHSKISRCIMLPHYQQLLYNENMFNNPMLENSMIRMLSSSNQINRAVKLRNQIPHRAISVMQTQ